MKKVTASPELLLPLTRTVKGITRSIVMEKNVITNLGLPLKSIAQSPKNVESLKSTVEESFEKSFVEAKHC